MSESAGLSPPELAAWRGLLRTHAALTRSLDEELQAQEGISLTEYDVLVQLADAPGRRLRMSDLAHAVLLSRSGLTRLVDDLERRELVRRERCAHDARGLEACLSEEGVRVRRRARATHLRGVRALFLDHLSERQLHELARTWEAVKTPTDEAREGARPERAA